MLFMQPVNIIENYTRTHFSGSFDCNGYVIRNQSYTATESICKVDLFGCTDNATLRYLSAEQVSFSAERVRVGGLEGTHMGTLTGSYATGSIKGTGGHVGGLVGVIIGSISDCYAAVFLYGKIATGGLVGDEQGIDQNNSLSDNSIVWMEN